MSQFTLDKVEQEILNARAAAAIGNPKDACFHLAQAIELLRKELTADKQPEPGFPPPLAIMPSSYITAQHGAPATFTGLAMMNGLPPSESHNISVRVTVDRLRCLCEDLVRSERIAHPSYSGVRGSGDAMALANIRAQIDRVQDHLNKLELENRAIAAFNERVAKLDKALLYRREYAERARNDAGDKWAAIGREKAIDLHLARVKGFIASDWGEVKREEPKKPWWGVLRDAFKGRDYSGPNWYRRYTPHSWPL